jgi:hypothetical protein
MMAMTSKAAGYHPLEDVTASVGSCMMPKNTQVKSKTSPQIPRKSANKREQKGTGANKQKRETA